jgi:3D (Asp-Asp-Asp) domain-containing protein
VVGETHFPASKPGTTVSVRLIRSTGIQVTAPTPQEAPAHGVAPPERRPLTVAADLVPQYGPDTLDNQRREGTVRNVRTGETFPLHTCAGKGGVISSLIAARPTERPSGPPTFGDGSIVFTRYYTTICEDFPSWGEFREATRIEGSGICRGRMYNARNIGAEPYTGGEELRADHPAGSTACGTNPTPKRSIAVNPIPGTPCYIPYGSLVYLEWDEGNPWNGWYIAEDTGGAFFGRCKIDVYMGIGKENYRQSPGPKSSGRVWVIPPVRGGVA